MSDLKTQPTTADVRAFLDSVKDSEKRADCQQICAWMTAATGAPPQMWGSSIIGFGSYHYRYASGREGDWFLSGFAPRAQNISLYIMAGFSDYDDLMGRLGKYKTGKSCLYIKRLSDVNVTVLQELIQRSIVYMRETYQTSSAST